MPVDPVSLPTPPVKSSLVIEDVSKEKRIVRILIWLIKKLM
jgi:hypothetical protein